MKRSKTKLPVAAKSLPPTLSAASIQRFSECACFNVRRFNRVLTQHFATALRGSELEATQMPLLARLAVGPTTLAELTDWLAMDRTTLLRNLKPLTRHRWIEDLAGTGGRARSLRLTASGHQLLAAAQPVWQRAQARVVAAFGRGEWNRLMAKMEKVATQLGKTGDQEK
jgi:DNA-binding MarR family transcriptional regulator